MSAAPLLTSFLPFLLAASLAGGSDHYVPQVLFNLQTNSHSQADKLKIKLQLLFIAEIYLISNLIALVFIDTSRTVILQLLLLLLLVVLQLI